MYKVVHILGFHSCNIDHGNSCYPPSMCVSSVYLDDYVGLRWFSVLLLVVEEKSSKHKAKFSKIPKIIPNQCTEWQELTLERRKLIIGVWQLWWYWGEEYIRKLASLWASFCFREAHSYMGHAQRQLGSALNLCKYSTTMSKISKSKLIWGTRPDT